MENYLEELNMESIGIAREREYQKIRHEDKKQEILSRMVMRYHMNVMLCQ
jgi:hypothetical protein